MTPRISALAALTATLFASAPAFADVIPTSYVSAFGGIYSNAGQIPGADSGSGSASITLSDSRPGSVSAASAYAASGVLKNYASVSASGVEGYTGVDAYASWEQLVTFVDPTRTGQRGFTTLSHYVEAEVSGSFSGLSASSSATLITGFGFSNGALGSARYGDYIAAGLMHTAEYLSDGTMLTQYNGYGNSINSWEEFWTPTNQPAQPFPSITRLPIEFIWGQTYTVFAWQQAECRTSNEPEGSLGCLIDASHSAYWGGIGQVFDENGNVVDNAKLLTADGRDFSNSMVPGVVPGDGPTEVPEPGSIALVLSGLALALARRRKRA